MISQQTFKLLFIALLALGTIYAFAKEAKPGAKAASIAIEKAWSRTTPPGANVAAGYARIINQGNSADKLIGGTSPVGRVEIHEMKMRNGVMQMRLLNGLAIPAKGSVELKPGGLHIMFVNVKAPLKQGQDLKATLNFQKAGKIETTFNVNGAGTGDHEAH